MPAQWLWAAALCIAFLGGMLACAGRAHAQGTGPIVRFDPPSRTIIVVAEPSKLVSEMIVGYNARPGAVFIYFLELNGGLVPGTGCGWLDPILPNLVACPPPPQTEVLIVKSPGSKAGRKLQIEIPKILRQIKVRGGGKSDRIEGSPNSEDVKTRKGRDRIDPAGGRDDVRSGAANDKVDTEDGERDYVNCAKGKRDVVKPDRKDKVTNCEVVK